MSSGQHQDLEDLVFIGRFRVLELLGSGARARVFRVLDEQLGVERALKEMHLSGAEEMLELKAEFRRVGHLSHAHLAAVHELFVTDDACFFTMDFVEGIPLGQSLQGFSSSARAHRVVRMLPALVGAIGALHRAGLTHGDVKPTNVVVGADHWPVLVDFGFTSAESVSVDSSGFTGTWAYAAPEAILGRPGRAADWFSLGVTLYEALTGELPYQGGEALTAKQIGHYEPLSRDDFPAHLVDIVEGLLQPDVEARFDGADVLELLAQARQDSRPPSSHARSTTFTGRDHELHEAIDFLTAPRAASQRILDVCGPSGIGKTRLLHEALKQVADDYTSTLILRANVMRSEAVSHRAFDPIIDALVEFLVRGEIPSRVLSPNESRGLARMFPVFRQLFPDEYARAHELAPQVAREVAASAVRSLLSHLTAKRPVILVFDDAHWADQDSADLARSILAHDESPPVAIVLSRRDGPPGPLVTQLLEWEAATGASVERRRLDLRPLRALDVERWMQQVQGIPFGETSALRRQSEELCEASHGLPFLVEVLLGSGEAVEASMEPEANVVLAVEERLKDLGSVARGLVRVAAAAREPCPVSIAFRTLEAPVDQSLVEHLSRRKLLRRERVVWAGEALEVIEIYHHALGETLESNPDFALGPHEHEALAKSWEASPYRDPGTLARHFHLAGNDDVASRYAEIAGDAAAEALTFDRAANWYNSAYDWAAPPSSRTGFHRPLGRKSPEFELLRKRAVALYNAGRCAEAGIAFQRAAAATTGAVALENRVMAVEASLVAGCIDEGLQLAKPLCQEVGVRLPGTEKRVAMDLLGATTHLLMRGTSLGSSRENGALELRVDLGWSLAKGLMYVMPLHGFAVLTRSLVDALELGDVRRAGRALAVTGAGLFTQIGVLQGVGEQYLERVKELAERHDDPYLLGMYYAWTAFAATYEPDWPGVLRCAERALEVFESECVGSSWERVVAVGLITMAHYWSGELPEAIRVGEQWLERSTNLGDVHGQILMQQVIAGALIQQGRTREARERLDFASERWVKRYTIVHFQLMYHRALASLCEGDAARARDDFLRGREEFKQAGGYRVPHSRLEAHFLEGRIYEACAGHELDTGVLRSSDRLARLLGKERRKDGPAHAAILLASRFLREGRRDRAVERLQQAARRYRSLDMGVYDALARHAEAKLVGDHAIVESTESWLGRRGIVPAHAFRWLAPGWCSAR